MKNNQTENNAAVGGSVSNGGLCPQRTAWEQQYSDGSGVQYAVRYDAVDMHYDGCPAIKIEAVNSADFPITQLDWLIECLQRIKSDITREIKE